MKFVFTLQVVEQKALDGDQRESGKAGVGVADGLPGTKTFTDRQNSIIPGEPGSPAEDDESATFRLLRDQVAGGLSTAQVDQLHFAESDLEGKKAAILLVDDSEDIRTVMVQILASLGYKNVSQAAHGHAALDLVRQREDFLPKPVNSVLLRARVSASLERKRLRDVERIRLIELQNEKQALEIEKEKSERLLLNILPKAMADRLKQGQRTIAVRHDNITALFADIVDFTMFARHTDPEVLVSVLNDLFSRFDRLTDQNGLEKIKTIGDSYFVAGGLPDPRPDHAEAVAGAALEMLTALADLNRELGTSLRVRIGLSSGPVVAGVIGRKKFTYDLWGATVNLASRMQSSGQPNRIQVSASTRELLGEKFNLTEGGSVACKGVGEVRTYFLEGKKA